MDSATASLRICAEIFGDYSGQHRWIVVAQGAEISLHAVASTATQQGLITRYVRCPTEDLFRLELPTIIRWNGRFAVLAQVYSNGRVRIFDTSNGWRIVNRSALDRAYGGEALELRPAPTFKRVDTRPELKISSLFRWSPLVRSVVWKAIVLTILVQLNAVLSPLYIQSVVDNVVGQGRTDLLTALAVGFALLALFNAAATIFRSLVLQQLTSILAWDMTRGVFHHLLRLPLVWFESRRLTDVLSRVQSVDQVRTFLATVLSGSVVDCLLSITMLIMMTIISAELTMVVVGFTSINVLLRLVTVKWVMTYSARSIDATAAEQGKRIENLKSAKTLKIMTAERDRERDWAAKFSRSVTAIQDVAAISAWIAGAQGLISGLALIVVVYLAAQAALSGAMTIGILFAFTSYQTQFTTRAAGLLDLMISWRTLDLHKERIGDVVLAEAEPEPSTSVGGETRPGLAIRLEGIVFGYEGQDTDVLRNVNIEVPEGQFIAITGPSGVGKSTLMKVLCGLYSPKQGSILVDGARLTPPGMMAFRQEIGVVLQDDDLLSGTILENISFFASEPDPEWAWQCLQDAQLRDEIAELRLGIHTHLGDLGTSLSGGQRQRIMLARALYRRPRLLLLDEATSHLDLQRESAINKTLATLRMTRIVIAHRNETIAAAEKAFELRDGKLVERPAH